MTKLPTYTRLFGWTREILDSARSELADVRLAIAIVEHARADLGLGQTTGNNRGPELERYGVGQGQAWCAAAAWSWISWAHASLGIQWAVPSTMGAKRLYRDTVRHGAAVELGRLRIADLLCWDRGEEGDWRGHVAIVSEVHGPGEVTAVHGNSGPRVRERRHRLADERRFIGAARATVGR